MHLRFSKKKILLRKKRKRKKKKFKTGQKSSIFNNIQLQIITLACSRIKNLVNSNKVSDFYFTAEKMNFSFKDFFSKYGQTYLLFTEDFGGTDGTLTGNLYFLCSFNLC